MRFTACGVTALLIIGCAPVPPLQKPVVHPPAMEERSTRTPAITLAASPVSQPVSPAPVAPPRITRQEHRGIRYEGIAFDSRSYRLAVVDQSGGPGSQFADAEAAGRSKGGLAAINAGFFTPEGTPLGLVISGGQSAGFWNGASSLGSGIWCQDASGNLSIVRRENLGRGGAGTKRELIQAGPMLIENQHPINGLEAMKTSVRSIILWDGGTRWWIGLTSPCTLAEVSENLSHASPAGWKARQALNFDGGRSSDLWISANVSGEPVYRRAPWNRPVRNFVVLIAR